MSEIVKALFPIHTLRREANEAIEIGEVPSFTETELMTAIRSLLNKKEGSKDWMNTRGGN